MIGNNKYRQTMKKLLLLCTALFALAVSVEAQSVDTANNTNDVFIEYEVSPSFPGGDEALYKFIEENLIVPQEAREKEIEGRVYVQFVVDTDGTAINPRVLRDIGGGCGEEALRIVRLMPKWTPGRMWHTDLKGWDIVPCKFILPITFNLKKKNK